MKRNCGRAAIGVAILPVRSPLSNLEEPEALQNACDLSRLQDRNVAHLRDLDGLRSDELPAPGHPGT
jgi:hypothetical protein